MNLPTVIDDSSDLMTLDDDAFFADLVARSKETLGQVSASYISTDAKRFTLPTGEQSSTLTCIVVGFARLNVLYPPFVKGTYKDPFCWAVGEDDKNLMPDPAQVQDIQSDTCTGCPKNQWGTANNGGKGKACANKYRLAVVAPDATPQSEIMILTVSPTGFRRWTAYTQEVGPGNFCRVTTVVTFDQTTTYPSLHFARGTLVNNADGLLQTLNRRARPLLLSSAARGD